MIKLVRLKVWYLLQPEQVLIISTSLSLTRPPVLLTSLRVHVPPREKKEGLCKIWRDCWTCKPSSSSSFYLQSLLSNSKVLTSVQLRSFTQLLTPDLLHPSLFTAIFSSFVFLRVLPITPHFSSLSFFPDDAVWFRLHRNGHQWGVLLAFLGERFTCLVNEMAFMNKLGLGIKDMSKDKSLKKIYISEIYWENIPCLGLQVIIGKWLYAIITVYFKQGLCYPCFTVK